MEPPKHIAALYAHGIDFCSRHELPISWLRLFCVMPSNQWNQITMKLEGGQWLTTWGDAEPHPIRIPQRNSQNSRVYLQAPSRDDAERLRRWPTKLIYGCVDIAEAPLLPHKFEVRNYAEQIDDTTKLVLYPIAHKPHYQEREVLVCVRCGMNEDIKNGPAHTYARQDCSFCVIPLIDRFNGYEAPIKSLFG